MSYTGIATFAVLTALLADIEFFYTKLIFKKAFWVSYSIILPFQLLTNWWLTSKGIVQYNPDEIIGWRIASAPVEDLAFGFALILGVLSSWVHTSRPRSNQRP